MLSGVQISTSESLPSTQLFDIRFVCDCDGKWAETRPTAAAVSPQRPSSNYTSLYERPRQCSVYSRSRQVRVPFYLRGGAHVIGRIAVFADQLERIRTGQIARVPTLLGNMEDDGVSRTYNRSESISTFLAGLFGSLADSITPNKLRALYPG